MKLRLVRRLHKVLSLRDCLKLLVPRPGLEEVIVRLKNREIILRANSSDIHCFIKVFIDEEYEIPFEGEPQFLLDAGANIGMATVYFATKYPKASILSIEPESSNFELLKRNCLGLKNVKLIRAALWPHVGRVSVECSGAEFWATRVHELSTPASGLHSVQATTISEVIRETGVQSIDLLKIDIEGAELELFAQGTEEWISFIKVIAIELHDRFRPGCASSFYRAISKREFRQEVIGENVFIKLL